MRKATPQKSSGGRKCDLRTCAKVSAEKQNAEVAFFLRKFGTFASGRLLRTFGRGSEGPTSASICGAKVATSAVREATSPRFGGATWTSAFFGDFRTFFQLWAGINVVCPSVRHICELRQ